MVYQVRKRTEPEDIVYALHLYFYGLSLRNTSKAISKFVTRSHTAIRYWIQKYNPSKYPSFTMTESPSCICRLVTWKGRLALAFFTYFIFQPPLCYLPQRILMVLQYHYHLFFLIVITIFRQHTLLCI